MNENAGLPKSGVALSAPRALLQHLLLGLAAE
jgi:hypothetical protein